MKNENNAIKYDSDYHKSKFNRLMGNIWLYRLKGEVARQNYFPDFRFTDSCQHKVLDYGSGVGQNTAWITHNYAFDLNKNLYPFLKKKGFKGTFNSEKDIPNNFFDDILVSQVLEHLDNPMETLKMLHKKLKINGKIRIVVPHMNYDVPKVLNGHNTDGHLQNWSFIELNYLLNKCGFEVVYNRKIYRRGTDSYANLAKLGFSLYMLSTQILGRIVSEFDVFVIARRIGK